MPSFSAPLPAPPTITGKAGTMKRKRQIRNALEHMDRGYFDDIFDSTPFKKKIKHVEVRLFFFGGGGVARCMGLASLGCCGDDFISFSQLQELSDDECFHDDEKSEESRPIRTPSEAKRRLGAPTSHTPRLSDYLTTPDLKSGMRR